MINNPHLELVRSHFNEPILGFHGLGRVIGYGEDDSDCYIMIKYPKCSANLPLTDGSPCHTRWHTMVGGYYWLNKLRGQNHVKAHDGEEWDDLYRLSLDLTRGGVPEEEEFLINL